MTEKQLAKIRPIQAGALLEVADGLGGSISVVILCCKKKDNATVTFHCNYEGDMELIANSLLTVLNNYDDPIGEVLRNSALSWLHTQTVKSYDNDTKPLTDD
jgi:hypothetical protein